VPVFVKRGVASDVAESLRRMLSSLGATVEILDAQANARAARAAVPAPSVAPAPAKVPSMAPPPPPAPEPAYAPPPPVVAAIPMTPAIAPASPALPAPKQSFTMSPAMMGIVILGVVVIAMIFVTRALRVMNDVSMLGNTVMEDTTCRGQFCLRGGPGIPDTQRTKRNIVVAWRIGCLDDDYRAFLHTLVTEHPGDVSVIAAGLAVPMSKSPRAFTRVPEPPPDVWPPSGCEPGVDVLPIERGYASDALSPPVTYLCDAKGSVIAVWRGGMGPEQRRRLVAWVEGKPFSEE
jgi:hypothetical protein